MADAAQVMTALREELIAAGLVRRPTEGANANGQPYPLAIEPPDGPPAPGELKATLGDDAVEHTELVVSILAAGGFAPATAFEARSAAKRSFDLRYRTRTAGALRLAMALDIAIRGRLIRPETNYGYGFQMGAAAPVWVHEATPIGELAPLGRSRELGYDHVAKWVIETAP